MRATLRDLDEDFDLLVIGAGIHGAFAARDAARRGLKVALVEQHDYGSGATGNSLRIAHGGLRYLARGDLPRMRESIRERAALMRLAPHLVRPLPCALPLEGGARRAAFASALRLNDLLVRAFAGSGTATLPPGRLLDSPAMFALAGAEWWGGASGAALWHDGLITSPGRLLIMVLRDAHAHGATMRNYTRVRSLARDATGRIRAAVCTDESGESAECRARVFLNATGPSSAGLLGGGITPACAWADGWNVVLRRTPPAAAIAIPHRTEGRWLFAVPGHRGVTIGTGYVQHAPPPSEMFDPAPRAPWNGERDARAMQLVEQVNSVRPDLGLAEAEISLLHAGVLPMKPGGQPASHALLDRPLIIDHEQTGDAPGVVTVIGVKWTTAREVAARAVGHCVRRLGGAEYGPRAGTEPLCHAERAPARARAVQELYGPLAAEVEGIAEEQPVLGQPLAPGCDAIGAQVAHAVRREGAVHLSDVLLRRTEIAGEGWPGEEVVAAAARVMGAEALWSEQRVMEELAETKRQLESDR
jgi:glycerol-3-phosphate dehydrogenase